MTESDEPLADGLLPVSTAPLEDAIGLAVDPGLATQPRSLQRATVVVAPALALANGLSYAFNVVLSRWLGPGDYGQLGALLGVALVGSVPAFALQPVAARQVARALRSGSALPRLVRTLGRTSWLVGASTGLFVALASPGIAAFLHMSYVPVLWVAASLVPLASVFYVQGVLQGSERFAALAGVYVLAAGARLVGGVALAALVGGVAGALAGAALGWLAAAVVALALVRESFRDSAVPDRVETRRELAHATGATLGLIVLANIDVLLARHYLDARAAGLYAVGAIFAKAAFWGPQFVAVLVFPRLSDPAQHARLLRRSAMLIGGSAAAVTLVLAAFGRPAVTLVAGGQYAGLASVAWVFGALGGALALAQLLLYSGLATADRRLSAAVWAVAGAGIGVIALWRHSSLLQIAGTSLATAVTLCVVGMLLARTAATVPAEGPDAASS